MRPIIGITSDFDLGEKKDSIHPGEKVYFLKGRYMSAIEDTGGIPMILPITSDEKLIASILKTVQGLLITGSGPDIDPAYYGEKPIMDFDIMSRERASFEMVLTKKAIEKGMPTLGICGGMQLINVALGGSLFQDIPTQVKGTLPHQQRAPKSEPSHSIQIKKNTRLFEIIKKPVIKVNSSHHQAVKGIGDGLRLNALSEDGIVEGVEGDGKSFILGVQWHPEFLYKKDEINRRLFEEFIRTCSALPAGRPKL